MNELFQALVHSTIPFMDITALVALTGAAFCILYMARPTGEPAAYQKAFTVRLLRLIVLCLSMLTVSTIAGLFGRGMEMSGLGFAASLPLLPTVVLKTHYGSMWLLRVAGLIAAWVVLIAGRRHVSSRLFGAFLLSAGAVIAFSRSASGHPADFGDLSPQQLADWLHLLGVSSWGGALVALAIIFPPSLVKEDSLQQRLVAGIADRFYQIFGPLLTIIVFTGLYNAWFQVGSFQALVTTPYGGLLSAKLLLLFFLALRYIAPPEHGRDETFFVMRFLQRTRLEAAIILTLLLCVALLVHQIPARHFMHLQHMQGSGGHAGHGMQDMQMHHAPQRPEPVVSLEIKPAQVSAGIPVDILVSIKDQNGKPLEGLEISHGRMLHAIIIGKDLDVFAHIHPEDIGPVTDEMLKTSAFPLRFIFPKAGEYLLGIDYAATGNIYSKPFSIDVAGRPVMGEPKVDFSTRKNFGDYRVTLTILPKKVREGGETTLRYVIEKHGKPVTDLEPYLGAEMHLAVVSEDIKLFIHAHGVTPGETHSHHDHLHAVPPPERFGPEIESSVVFPVKGIYKIFSQVRHHGKVLLFNFMVNVQ